MKFKSKLIYSFILSASCLLSSSCSQVSGVTLMNSSPYDIELIGARYGEEKFDLIGKKINANPNPKTNISMLTTDVIIRNKPGDIFYLELKMCDDRNCELEPKVMSCMLPYGDRKKDGCFYFVWINFDRLTCRCDQWPE